ncbi:MAG: hypothetical protein VYA55_00540 [Pseudomonadota bacterium]|nr:hypothetical protein [Pseudomonadota bacterium]
MPYFLYSDFLDVGYAYHWIAPPSEVYELGGFDNIDGVNLEYYGDWGPVISRLNFIVGATSTTSGDLDVSSEDHWVISWNMNWDWLTFQATYSESAVTVDGINLIADGINDIMTASGFPLTSDQLNSLDMDRDRGYFSGVGLAADWGTFFASAEYTDVGVDDSPLNNQKKSWYVSGGFRTGKFTYSLTVSNADLPNNPDTIDTLTDDLIPLAPGDQNVMFFLDQAIAGAPDTFAEYSTEQLVDAINSTLIAGYDVDTYNFTVRYDFHPSAALKFDYSKQEADYFDVYGNTTSREPELVRIGVDLVF